MSTEPDRIDPDPDTATADRADATRGPGADRMPTTEEERRADEAAEELADEMPAVAEHYEEMTRIGAEVKGEGEIPG